MPVPILSLTAVVLLLPALRIAQGTDARKAQVSFDAAGLSGIALGETGFLGSGAPGQATVWIEEANLDEKGYRQYQFTRLEEAPKSTFDAAGRVLKQQYTWGSVDIAYKPRPDGLGLALTLANTGGKPIADFDLKLLGLKLPSAPEKIAGKGAMPCSLDNLAIVQAICGNDKLLTCCETIDPPVYL